MIRRTRAVRTSATFMLLFAMLILSPSTGAAVTGPAPTGLQPDVVFANYPAFANSGELLRRLLSPLNALHVREQLIQSRQRLGERPIDPSREHFALYVPPGPPPPNGYALLVFIPPWDDARVPPQWIATLDREHVIFISAAHSGNDTDVLDRREPLALLAEYGVARRYPVDPSRVYAGGFSGGSRIALRLALAYPDVFRGALLDAGSDPIGTAQVPLPPAELFRQFQQSTRLVYLTGANDRGLDKTSIQSAPMPFAPSRPGFTEKYSVQGERASPIGGTFGRSEAPAQQELLQEWCMQAQNIDEETLYGVGHELVDAAALDRALHVLDEPIRVDQEKFVKCRAAIDERLNSQLKQVDALLENGKPDDARKLLEQIDARYGGLAAPRSVELMRQAGAQR